jgi:hypothetical protein
VANLICTIQLDKKSGILVRIQGEATTQTLTMDGTTLTLEVKGEAGTSTITQTADAVKIDCTTFTVNATGNATIHAGAALALTGTSNAEVSAASVKVEADGVATLKGQLTNVQGQLVKLG